MKRIISILLLVSLLALSAFAYEEFRYGVAVWDIAPQSSDNDSTTYKKVVENAFDLLDYELISIDKIDGETLPLEALDGYKVLILPSLEIVDTNTLDTIKSFVNDGGKLLISANKLLELPSEFFELTGFTVSGTNGTQMKFLSENGLVDSNKKLQLASPVAVKPLANTEVLANFVSENGEIIAPAVLKSNNAIIIAGDVFNNLNKNEALQDLVIEAVYNLGDTRILSGFAPLGLDEWRPMVQVSKATVRRARSAIRSAENQFRAASDEINALYEKADKARELMEYAYDAGNALRITPYFKVAEELAKEVIALTQPVSLYEARAVWMDEITISRAGSPNALRDVIRQLYEAGFNMILPEVVYIGRSIYPSKFDIQEPKYQNWSEDPLRVIVDEAKKYGMEVHAWTWVFCAGYNHKFGPILEQHPEWAEQDEAGRVFSNWSYGTAWLNASMPEVRNYLKELFLEIVTEYDVDGLHLDYIRYNEDNVGHFGLSDYSRNVFKSKYGFDPKSVKVGSADWKLFDQWREDNVTSFVKEMTDAVKEAKADLKISAAVVPDPSHSRREVLQNWKNWADNKILDFILTMAYTDNNSTLRDRTNAGLTVTENKIWVYPGLGVYVNTSENNVAQAQLSRSLGATGVAMFSTIHLLNQPEKLVDLQKSVFREPAIIPHTEPIKALKGLIKEAAEVHVNADRKEIADELFALSESINEDAADKIALMEETAVILSKYLQILEGEKNDRTLSNSGYEALSGSLLSAWRITQIYIYQNTDRPFIQPEPR